MTVKELGGWSHQDFSYGATGIKLPLKMDDPVIASLPPDVKASLDDVRSSQDLVDWYNAHQDMVDTALSDNDYTPATFKDHMVNDILAEELRFGTGWGMDLTIGIRFP